MNKIFLEKLAGIDGRDLGESENVLIPISK